MTSTHSDHQDVSTKNPLELMARGLGKHLFEVSRHIHSRLEPYSRCVLMRGLIAATMLQAGQCKDVTLRFYVPATQTRACRNALPLD